jgi:GNAT superfamily N-acetyltransferase
MNTQRTFWYALIASISLATHAQAMQLLHTLLQPVITVTARESEDKIQYNAYLKNRFTGRVYGTAVFTFYPASQIGMLVNLRINRAVQNKGYGSRLLQFALDTFARKHPECDVVKLLAKPLDIQYDKGETPADVFPKLIAFYKRNNAQVTYIDHELAVAKMEFRKTESYM